MALHLLIGFNVSKGVVLYLFNKPTYNMVRMYQEKKPHNAFKR